MGTLDRRGFLKAAGGGALLLAAPGSGIASVLGGPKGVAAGRASRLSTGAGTFLLHADLHNHTLLSDGDGDATAAFASMRNAGLDVAAVTDHTTISKGLPVSACSGDTPCNALGGLNDTSWEQWRALADAANQDGAFTAIRGFEWSSPSMGHVNVWFSEQYTDPLHDAGLTTGEGGATFMHSNGGFPPIQMVEQYESMMRLAPSSGASMALFYEWMSADPARPVRHGGADALCGFNHPGREPGRFGYFDPRFRDLFGISDRVVSIEMFNRREDYLFEGIDAGQPSPLVDCLDQGWKVGILGVTDEHGDDWGYPDGKGRAGIWVSEHTREGVREAMRQRRFFATNLKGLRLDAALNGVRMGGTLSSVGSSGTIELDIDRGSEWVGRPLVAQVLASGRPLPHVLATVPFTVPGPSDPVVTFTTPVDADDRWLVLRITDPSKPADGRADALYKSFGQAIAYASPFFIER